jgi:hypothetical protein
VGKRRQYTATPQIDDTLRAIYEKARGNKVERAGLPSLKRYAKRLGWPEYQLYKRAAELGLSRPRRKAWSAAELKMLNRWAHLTHRAIAAKMKRAGYVRSPTAICQKMLEQSSRSESDYYTARQLALCLGYQNGDKVRRWIRGNMIAAERRGTEREHNDDWLIKESEIRRFILANPLEIDLRKVDQTWFFDIMFEGKAGMTTAEALREPELRPVDDSDDGDIPDESAVIGELIARGEYASPI